MSRRSAQGTGTIRKRRDGRWEARYTAGFDPITGKQIQRSVYGKTQQEVRQKLTKVTAEIDAGTYLAPRKETVEEWLKTWLEVYAKHSVKPYTYDSYERVCRNHIIPSLGKIKLTELSSLDIQRLYIALQDQKGLSPKSVKNVHGIFHRALEKAVKLGMIKFNPTDACEPPKGRRKELNPIEPEDVGAFQAAIRDHRYGRVYWVTIYTGLRQGEVLGLTWDCVDFEHNTIFINKQLQKTKKVGGEYVLTSTKTSRSRVITVAPSVMAKLREQKQWQERMAELLGPEWSNEWNLVFTHENGRHLCPFTVYRAFKTIVTKMGRPEVRFHDLRHSFALISLESGDDIKTLQGNLGHATASFTLDTYGHISQQMRRQSADRMERFIQGVKEE